MIFTYFRVFTVMSLLFLAMLIAQVKNLISVESPRSASVLNSKSQSGFHQLSSEDREIFVFAQITDLHISYFTDPERTKQLSEFCLDNLKAINPELVLVSGDLTDAIAPNKLVASQFEQEWLLYKNFYTQCQHATNVTTWLDLRGNHDNFNVNGYNSSANYYPKYAAQRERYSSYMVTVNASEHTRYAFVAVDATLTLGPKRILNFIGALDASRLEKLEEFKKSINNDRTINGTIWFGHYPTSSILSPRPGLRQIAANGIAYLCGHLHNLVGLVPQMYTHHHSGMLELELADWKLNRMYRVAVLDHGLFSFTDVKHGSWPVIVVTNPKPAETVQPSKEPTALMVTSSHIRLLIYSPSAILSCEVKIDDGKWFPCHPTGKKHPLYTAPWQPSLYSSGLHTLEVRARDASGSQSHSTIEFSLDGRRSDYPTLGRLALMVDITTLVQVLFGVSVAGCVVPFCVMRAIHQRLLSRRSPVHRFKYHWIRAFVRKMWIFATVDCLFYPLASYTLYLTFGPWFVGHLIDGNIGAVFAWGAVFRDHFLPGTFTYFYGLMQVLLFNAILILLLGHTADLRFQKLFIRNQRKESWTRHLHHVPFAVFFLLHVFTIYPFWVSYGYMATLLNPLRTWCLFLALHLWIKANCLGEVHLAGNARLWI